MGELVDGVWSCRPGSEVMEQLTRAMRAMQGHDGMVVGRAWDELMALGVDWFDVAMLAVGVPKALVAARAGGQELLAVVRPVGGAGPERLFGNRFVACALNGDHGMCRDLFDAHALTVREEYAEACAAMSVTIAAVALVEDLGGVL